MSGKKKVHYPPFSPHVDVMRPSPLRHFRDTTERRTEERGDLDVIFHGEIGNNRLRTDLNKDLLTAFGNLDPDQLCYTESDGVAVLKEKWIPIFCPEAAPEELLIGGGITGLLKRLARLYAGCGCLAFGPTYPNMIGIARDMGMNLYNWPRLPDQGWAYPSKEALSKFIHDYAVGLIYLQPHSNPDGTVLPLAVWDMIMELVDEYGLLIISDEPYPHTNYSKRPTRSITHYDEPKMKKRWAHLSGLSKTLECGLRLGGVYTPNQVLQDKLQMSLQRDLSGSSPASYAAAAVMADTERFQRHLQELHVLAKGHRDTLLESLAALDEESFTIHTPQSSYYVVVTIEGRGDGSSVAEYCAKQGVFQDSQGRRATVLISPVRPCYDGVKHQPCRMIAQTVHQAGNSEFRVAFCYLSKDNLKEIGFGLQSIYESYLKSL